MTSSNFNNDFFSYQGTIGRKNYIINTLILVALYIGISLINFERFEEFFTFKLLYSILIFIVGLFKFIIIMSVVSIIYRRISDISYSKSLTFDTVMKRIFVILYVFPLLYFLCIRYFIDIIPIALNILDFVTLFILLPLSTIFAIIISFIKGR